MSDIKYIIEAGNCSEEIKDPIVIEAGLWTADSIVIKADSITATADGTTQ